MILRTSCERCRGLVTVTAPSAFPTTCDDCEPAPRALTDLERRFIAAVFDGDASLVDELADTLDRTREPGTGDLRANAARLAVLGWPVFPLRPGDKVPATPNGFKDATTDVERVDRYWSRNPTANIGVPTGHKFDVVDVDYKVDGAALSWADIRDSEQFEVDALVNTPRGIHAYVLPTGDGNRARLKPGIDYRGLGGYVVVPPSMRPDGTYRWWSKPSPRLLQ